MNLIEKLPDILRNSRVTYERLRSERLDREFVVSEILRDDRNALVSGDNLNYMRWLLQNGMEGRIDLIYIDPPYNSKANYVIDVKVGNDKKKLSITKHTVFTDKWEDGLETYLEMMAVRLYFMKALLSDTGSLFVHVDWHCSHYLKVVMDEIFGQENFINEIIWHYKSGGVSKRYFARKHDCILFYSKSKYYYFEMQKEKSYNRELKPYRFKGVKEYKDDTGWYTLVSMKDVWQIDMVGRTSGERTGYATQKPEALIERILTSASQEGDLCADFFCGSGTLGAVAERMGRRFLLCDSGKAAVMKAHKRLAEQKTPHALLQERKRESNERKRESQDHLHVDLDIIRHDDLAGSMTVRLKNLDYRNLESFELDEKGEALLKDALKNDFTQFIEYWCVDTAYDGQVIRPKAYFCRNKENVPRETVVLRQKNRNATDSMVAVKIMDVFGNEFVDCSPV